MDMERIKQNLRLRSGRTKKTSKRYPTGPPTQQSPGDQSKQQQPRPVSQYQNTALPQQNGQKQTPVPEEKKGSPHGTRLNGEHSLPPKTRPKTVKRNDSNRYGRSGVDRPPTRFQEPNSDTKINHQAQANRETASSDEADFDLKPPPSKPRPTSIDTLCEMLFSAGHLNIMLHDPSLMSRFSGFLNKYKPELSAIVLQYLEYQKAIKAIEYANAVAERIKPIPVIRVDDAEANGSKTPTQENANPHESAATLSKSFAETSQRAYDLLVHEALPAYVTYTLVKLSMECLTAEITSRAPTSLTSNLIGGLSEVFCLSDPTLPDNPLIYCSEEFYRLTGYTSGDVLGRNCRFLQGPKTDKNSVRRIKGAIERNEGCTETVLNYRRDGRGFVNVLMISPLEDDKGKVKYFLGAQVDVSRLVAGGWGLEGLEKLVQRREMDEIRGRRVVKGKKDEALRKLTELSEMFDLEESAIVRNHSRSRSLDGSEAGSGVGSAGGSDRPKQARRVFGDDGEEGSGNEDDDSDTATEEIEKEKGTWKLATTGSSGKLPGLYRRYLLIRPAPSLRVIFISPALRKRGNILQKPFLSHLAAPTATLSGLKESFTSGTPVTAKVAFMVEPGTSKDGTATGKWKRTSSGGKNDKGGRIEEKDPNSFGTTCWISATPLLGGDEEIGVWMVVFVDKNSAPASTLSKTKGQGMKHQQLEGRAAGIIKASERTDQIQMLSDEIRQDDIPIKPMRVGGTSANGTPRKPDSPSPPKDREAAREMYDNDGNEAVQAEAKEDASEPASGELQTSETDSLDGTVPSGDGTTEESPSHERKAEYRYDTKDPEDFEKVPSKASITADEDSPHGLGEDEENYVADDEEHEDHEEAPSGDASNDNDEDDNDTFVRRRSQSLTPPHIKERVVIRSDTDSDVEREVEVDTAADESLINKHSSDEEEWTPTRKGHHHTHGDEGYEEGEGSRPGTSSSKAPLYMDYLRHPGTRKERNKAAQGETTPSDPDCEVWSPYSVD